MKRHTLFTLAAAIAGLTLPCVATSNGDTVHPDICNTTHASSVAVEFLKDYFAAKTHDNIDSIVRFFHPTQAVYYDATLGWQFPNQSSIVAGFLTVAQSWPANASSYLLHVFGDKTSAVVYFVDTPGLFGAELHVHSAIDFLDGKITRQVDYWDGRGISNPVKASAVPDDQYPFNLGLNTVREQAPSQMDRAVRKLNAALSAGNAVSAAALFTSDAIFEDATLHTKIVGQLSISLYLQLALSSLPYGPGTTVRHVLGNVNSGGYEWATGSQSVRNGITTLQLDCDGFITRFTAMWDGSKMNDTAIQALAQLSIAA